MKKCASNFARTFFAIFIFFAHALFANVPFSISGSPQATEAGVPSLDDPSVLSDLIGQLKQRAVQEWLQGQLGDRFPQFEKQITAEFSERYVLDYKVVRSGAKREVLELTGHLDSDSLKNWIRLQDTRKGNTSLKPLLLFSSNLQDSSFSASESGEKLRDFPLGQNITHLLNPLFQKLNVKPIYADHSSPLSQPARFDSDIGMLRDYATQMGANAAVWVHLQACGPCTGGGRVDLILYSIQTQRIAVAESEELNLKPQEWGNGDRVKSVLGALFSQFQSGVESQISNGQFYGQQMRVVIEGIQNPRQFKAIESELGQADFLSGSYLKRAGGRTAEFEVLTLLTADDLTRRIQTLELAGLHGKAQKFDSRTVVVRYSK